jgi:Ni/Co efflux regulator RcnB
LENGVRDFNYKSHGPPEKLNGNLYGAGFLSVDFPSLVDYLGGGGCELVPLGNVFTCAGELVETAGLAFHRFPILSFKALSVWADRALHSSRVQSPLAVAGLAVRGSWQLPGSQAGLQESRIEEGHLLPDHVHMMIAIPPKYAVSQVIGFIKGKSAIHLARVYGERKRNFVGQHFWARGDYVSTVGRDETVIRDYIRNQEQEDKRLDQMNL